MIAPAKLANILYKVTIKSEPHGSITFQYNPLIDGIDKKMDNLKELNEMYYRLYNYYQSILPDNEGKYIRLKKGLDNISIHANKHKDSDLWKSILIKLYNDYVDDPDFKNNIINSNNNTTQIK